MSTDGQGTKCRRNIAENYNRLSMVHERDWQTDRQTTDGRATAYSEREHEFTFVNVNMSSRSLKSRAWRCSIKHKPHTGRRKGRKMPFFVPGDLDLWPWHSNSSQRGTKHVFHVNVAEIRLAVPEIFHTQIKKVTDSAKNRTLRSSLRAVTNGAEKVPRSKAAAMISKGCA